MGSKPRLPGPDAWEMVMAIRPKVAIATVPLVGDAPPMGGFEILLQTPDVRVALSSQPPAASERTSADDWALRDTISLVEAGSLAVTPARAGSAGGWLLAQGMVFTTPRDAELTWHLADSAPPTRWLSISLSAGAMQDLRAVGCPALPLAAARASLRQRFLRRRLRNLCAAPGARDSSPRAELLAGALYESCTEPATTVCSASPIASAVLGHIANAADFIDAEFGRPLKLADMARVANMSTFHFARTFARVTGMPPHRYLVSVRLREAVQRMERGDSVTTACYAVGFSSPSHFTTAFRRHVGVLPSTLRQRRGTGCAQVALGTSLWHRWHRHASGSPELALGA